MSTKCEDVQIETRAAATVVGTARSYTMATRNEIPGQWQAFFTSGYDIKHVVQGASYGVSFDADETGFRYGVGLEVTQAEDLPEGTCAMELSAGEHAVLRAEGPVTELPQQFDMLFSQWLPASDYQQRPGAVFERYPNDPDMSPDHMRYEIWVPVKRR